MKKTILILLIFTVQVISQSQTLINKKNYISLGTSVGVTFPYLNTISMNNKYYSGLHNISVGKNICSNQLIDFSTSVFSQTKKINNGQNYKFGDVKYILSLFIGMNYGKYVSKGKFNFTTFLGPNLRIGNERVFLTENNFENNSTTFQVNSIGFNFKNCSQYNFNSRIYIEFNINYYQFFGRGKQINLEGFPGSDKIKIHNEFLTSQFNLGLRF